MVEPVVFTMTARVRAPPERVWEVLGDFGNEHRWTRLLAASARDRTRVEVGTVRRCELARPVFGARVIEEELTAFAWGESLAYRVRGGLGPFARVESAWRTRRLANGDTLVEVRALMTPRKRIVRALFAPLLSLAMRWQVRGSLREFAEYVESRTREVPA